MAIEEKSANVVTNGPETGPSVPRPDGPERDERYDAQRVEKKWFERWKQDSALYAA